MHITNEPYFPKLPWFGYFLSIPITIAATPVWLGVMLADKKAGILLVKNLITRLDAKTEFTEPRDRVFIRAKRIKKLK